MTAPPTYTEDIHRAFIETIASGGSVVAASGRARVPVRTLYKWLAKGESEASAGEDTVLASLYLDFVEAKSNHEMRLVRRMEEFSSEGERQRGQLDGTKFLLERRHREEWGRQVTELEVRNTSKTEAATAAEVLSVWEGAGLLEVEDEDEPWAAEE